MFESKINRGRANGYAPLDGSGKVPLDKLPPIQSTINTGSFAITGSNEFIGNQTISGSLTTTEFIQTSVIQATGSLYLQPDSTDNRHFEIYNTSPTDVHIKSNGGLSFFGDDTNYLKIDDSAGDVTIAAFSDIILTTDDGGVYIGSYGSDNGVITNGYLNTIIGDTDIINGATGNSITDAIGRIPIVNTGSFATTSSLQTIIDATGSFATTSSLQTIIDATGSFATIGSNSFNGNQSITGSLSISVPNGIPSGVANWIGQGGWNQNFYSNISTMGGTGTGLTVDVAAGGGGYINISAITINNPGSGYADGDAITINNENNLPGTFTLQVGASNFEFNTSGSLVFPDSTTQTTAFNSTLYITTSSFNEFTASLDGVISGSSQLTSSFDSRYALSGSIQNITLSSNLVSSSAQITAFGFVSSSATIPAGTISGSSQLTASFDTRYAPSASYLTSLNGAISSSTQLTSSFELKGSGIYSSSAQLPSGLISGSSQLPLGIVSGSSQLTSSLDLRYQLSGSAGVVPAGTISSSAQLTSSFDSRYVLETETGSLQNSITSLNTLTSSLATTGSNSFNGNQVVTGSLTVSSIATISSSIAANASALTLSSGSNFYIQNNGIAEITGSLIVSGSTTLTGSLNVGFISGTTELQVLNTGVTIGNIVTDRHNITGSLNISGSSTLTGSISISSGSIIMPNRPGFRVYGLGGATTAVTVLSGSMTIVDYNQGGWDNTTGTFTAPIAGLYQVNLVCRTNSNSSAQSVQVIVYKNYTGLGTGTAQIMVEWAANTTANHIGGSTISRLAVGDTLRAVVSVGTASFDANDNFSVAYIG